MARATSAVRSPDESAPKDTTSGAVWSGGRMAGVDPGSNTGIVVLDVPASLRIEDARWITSDVLRPSASQKLATDAARDGELGGRILAFLRTANVLQVAAEEPLDATEGWTDNSGVTSRRAKGSSFRLGAYYALVTAAAWQLEIPMTSYPVIGYRKRQGWMAGTVGGTRNGFLPKGTSETIHARMRALAFNLGARGDVSEHECMALGVLAWHLQQMTAGPSATLAKRLRDPHTTAAAQPLATALRRPPQRSPQRRAQEESLLAIARRTSSMKPVKA
jgi:hypothetical protein